MKILKSIGSLILIACGAYVSYLAFLAYDLQDWTKTLIYLGGSLLLLCFGIVTMLLTLTKKPVVLSVESSVEEPRVAMGVPIETEETDSPMVIDQAKPASPEPVVKPQAVFTEETNSDEVAELDVLSQDLEHEEESELVEGMSETAGQEPVKITFSDVDEFADEDVVVPLTKPRPVEEPQLVDKPTLQEVLKPSIAAKPVLAVETIEETDFPTFKTHMDQVEIKEDPKFLFGDWWVDEQGLFIDMRLIGISGRKAQKVLKKLPLNAKLEYHVSNKNDAIEILHDKVVLGMVPDLYLHSLLMYLQGIETVKSEAIVKKGRDVVQFTVKVRFDDDLREKLQKKLQQKTWQ
ncbi:MAG: hypothetical protein WBL80_09095 [Erysipelotrichaceae bacterium]